LQLGRGLQAIHEAGVIHRDLKTPNIMRDAHGDVRLLDFGIAKLISRTGTLAVTSVQKVVGTPEYMSPEQIRGSELDARSDIYAVGIVMYELFTGAVPFQGKTPLDTLLKQVNEPPPLEGEQPRIPTSMLGILRKALAKDPNERHASSAELVDAVRLARKAAFPDAPATPPDTDAIAVAALTRALPPAAKPAPPADEPPAPAGPRPSWRPRRPRTLRRTRRATRFRSRRRRPSGRAGPRRRRARPARRRWPSRARRSPPRRSRPRPLRTRRPRLLRLSCPRLP